MTSLDTSKAGTTENMMNLDPRVSHCFPHQFCLKSSNHSQGAITGETFGSISPWRNTWRHVEVFPLIASIFVKTVGNPGSKCKVNPFTVSRNVQLPGSRWSKVKMGYTFMVVIISRKDIKIQSGQLPGWCARGYLVIMIWNLLLKMRNMMTMPGRRFSSASNHLRIKAFYLKVMHRPTEKCSTYLWKILSFCNLYTHRIFFYILSFACLRVWKWIKSTSLLFFYK